MRSQKGEKAELSKGMKILIGILVIVCVLAGVVYIDTFYGGGKLKSYVTQVLPKEKAEGEEKGNQALESMDIDGGSRTYMAVFGKKFMLCTKDGVKYYNSMGDQKWNDTFNMSSPAMVQEGSYVAVGDMSGKLLRVYGGEGLLYEVQAEGTIIQFALNEKGALSLITKKDNTYRIRVYNEKGTLLKERVEESSGVYPLSSDVSDDGRVFAVSYLDTTDIVPLGKVVLFYINAAESENHTDSMFAGVEKKNEILPVISYMQGGTLAVLSDKSIYGINGEGVEKWAYELENTIDYGDFTRKDTIVLALGDSVANKDGRAKGTVCWINADGKETASYEQGESITYLRAADKGVVIGCNRSYIGLTHSGNPDWAYEATQDMGDLIPMEKLNRVMVISQAEAAIYDMSAMEKEEKAPEEKPSSSLKEEETESPAVQEEPLQTETEGTAGKTSENEGEEPEIPTE